MRRLSITTIALICFNTAVIAEPPGDIAPDLMRLTYRIEGPSKDPGKTITGTTFLLSQPLRKSPPVSLYVLVTASHVLNDINGDSAVINLTWKQQDGAFKKVPHPIEIRQGGTNLWMSHPRADVAVMIASLPRGFTDTLEAVPGTALLLDDDALKENDLRPGEELQCLGFPLGLESSAAGFPILRSGKIASFPVYPSQQAPEILIDARIFGGNSGGPVFFDFSARHKFGKSEKSLDWRGIVGVLSQDISNVQRIEGYFESSMRRDPLGLAVVVPSHFVKETIALLMTRNGIRAEQGAAEVQPAAAAGRP